MWDTDLLLRVPQNILGSFTSRIQKNNRKRASPSRLGCLTADWLERQSLSSFDS